MDTGFFMVLHTLSTLGTLYSNDVHSAAGGTLDEAIDPDGAAVGCRFSGWFAIAGILLFSGSLYVLAVTGMRWLGIVTPVGGLAFILSWLLMALGVYRGLES